MADYRDIDPYSVGFRNPDDFETERRAFEAMMQTHGSDVPIQLKLQGPTGRIELFHERLGLPIDESGGFAIDADSVTAQLSILAYMRGYVPESRRSSSDSNSGSGDIFRIATHPSKGSKVFSGEASWIIGLAVDKTTDSTSSASDSTTEDPNN